LARDCNQHILQALELARRLTILADQGEGAAEDDSCVVLYGVVRDCAYRIRRLAEREREAHIARGLWDERASNRGEPQEPGEVRHGAQG
jgi:hypothetical protein